MLEVKVNGRRTGLLPDGNGSSCSSVQVCMFFSLSLSNYQKYKNLTLTTNDDAMYYSGGLFGAGDVIAQQAVEG